MGKITAYLSSEGRYTIFRYGTERLKFIGPYSLERYLEIVEWNEGYIVVMAKYSHDEKPVEEYIDLLPILDNLMIDRDSFVSLIYRVEVKYD